MYCQKINTVLYVICDDTGDLPVAAPEVRFVHPVALRFARAVVNYELECSKHELECSGVETRALTKIPIIKLVRELSGVGLKEAKDAVDYTYALCKNDGLIP